MHKQQSQNIGILLVNLGTPDKAEKPAVRRYLKEFLMDPRVISLPFPLRYILVNGIIIPLRLKNVTQLYKEVWQQDSPIREILFQQQKALQKKFDSLSQGSDTKSEGNETKYFVEAAMTYGQPGISQILSDLLSRGIEKLVVLPLYPQYSATTSAPVFEQVNRFLEKGNNIPSLFFIKDYYRHPDYIAALAGQIKQRWQDKGKPERLVLSFHGIPVAYAEAGDPYIDQCHHTANSIKKMLEKENVVIETSFQSRVGAQEWAKPYTGEMLKGLATEGIKNIEVMCPGFAADCLETLHEIGIEYKDQFLEDGGKEFFVYPALNDSEEQIELFFQLSGEAGS